MRPRLHRSRLTLAILMAILAGACGAPVDQGSPLDDPSVRSPAPDATPAAASPTPTPAGASTAPPATVIDRYLAQATDPGARWSAGLDGWFITSEIDRSINLYPVSGTLDFSGVDHHLVLAMPEPEGIRIFEQHGGPSSLLDAMRSTNLTLIGPEAIDGHEVSVLRSATPVQMTDFGQVNGPLVGPATGTLEILVDDLGSPVRMRVTTIQDDGQPGVEALNLDISTGDPALPVPRGTSWEPFESQRFGYVVDAPADFEQGVEGEFDVIRATGYGGWDVHRYDLEGMTPADFAAGYLDFAATEQGYGEPINIEEYLTVGAHDEGRGIITTFHYEKDGAQRVAIVALFVKGDQAWDVTWRGFAENEVRDRTMLLQMLSTWRFTD